MEKKGLKLKLKLGSTPEPPLEMETAFGVSVSDEEEDQLQEEMDVSSVVTSSKDKSHKKSKKKKKKKEKEKHRHKRERNAEADEDGDKKRSRGEYRSLQEDTNRVTPAAVTEAFQTLTNYLLQQLIKKDVHQFFLEPVTDAIAPGYSSIISEPMCLKAMQSKIIAEQYSNLAQFENDVKLMVSNCLKYNGPDTVYSSEGKKLLTSAQTLLSKEKLLELKSEIPTVVILPPEMIGFPLFDSAHHSISDRLDEDNRTDSPTSQGSSHSDGSLTDDDDSASIVSQVSSAAREAALKLHRKKPTSTMGYLKPRSDGRLGLNFISGCEGSDPVSTPGRPVLNMGLVVGKLASGSGSLHNYHDDKRTMAKPVKPIQYGSYSSFCPSYDSTFSNLSKEESDLVRATYGTETAVQYAESICDFSRDCPMGMSLVDQLLNLMTRNQHSKTQSILASSKEKTTEPQSSDLCRLRSLSSLGIDVGFIDSLEEFETKGDTGPLGHTADLVQSLAKEQSTRLSKPLTLVTGSQATASEVHLAEKLRAELVSVAKQLPPSAILPSAVQ